jgi:hypothetical protein
MMEWPTPYIPGDASGVFRKPSLSIEESITVGDALAEALIRNEPFGSGYLGGFATYYLAAIKLYHRMPEDYDFTAAYKVLIVRALQGGTGVPDLSRFNEHDFANIHRAAWLAVTRALCRLVGFSPFYDAHADPPTQWGDPPDGGVRRGAMLTTKRGMFFIETPNTSGFYAIHNRDFDGYEGEVLVVPPPPSSVTVPSVTVCRSAS